MSLFAVEWGTGQVFVSMLWFFLFVIWIWLLILVLTDLFRSHDLGGVAKALWVVLVIVLPYLGVLIYVIVRGHKMGELVSQTARARDAAMGGSVPTAASNPADELE